MPILLLLILLFVAVPLLAVRYGAESRSGFTGSADWRPLRD